MHIDSNECIVYSGQEFTIEWYYTKDGKSQARNYFNKLDRDRKLEAYKLFKTIATIGKILNITKFGYEGNGIFAFKPKPDRFLCFFITGKKIIITNAFEKKKDKLSPIEKTKALIAKQDYKIRSDHGSYYE